MSETTYPEILKDSILEEIRVPWPANLPNDGWPRPPKRIIWIRIKPESLRGPCGLCGRPIVAQVSVDGWPGVYDEEGHEHVCVREEILAFRAARRARK